MNSAANSLTLIVVTLVMLAAGIEKKRLEWKRRDRPWLRKRKPPTNGRRAGA